MAQKALNRKWMAAFVRHVLTGVGMVLVSKGYTSDDVVMELLPGLTLLVSGLAWSAYEKWAR